MGLVKCPDCGREVSEEAKACPGCGRPAKALGKKKFSLAPVLVILLLVLFGIVYLIAREISVTSNVSVAPSVPKKDVVEDHGKDDIIKNDPLKDEKFISLIKEFEFTIGIVDPRMEMTRQARQKYGSYDGEGSLIPTERGKCLVDSVVGKSKLRANECPRDCEKLSGEELIYSKDWAHGIDNLGNFWKMGYVVTKNARLYMVFHVQRKNMVDSQIYGLWQIVLK